MLKINRLLITIVLIFMGLPLAAQNNTNSPYTRFGYGDLGDRSFGAGRAMGGVGYGLRSPKQINPMNPASYSCMDSLTFIFDFGVSLQSATYKDASNKYKKLNGNIEYIALQFPITRWLAMSAGLLPYSFVGYEFGEISQVDGQSYVNMYSGTGGLNDLYGGLSIDVWKKRLAIGANFGYLFGNVEHLQQTQFGSDDSTTPYQNYRTQRIEVRDMKMDFGVQYTHPLSATESLTFGVTYSPKNRLNTKTYDTRELRNGNTVVTYERDTIQGATYDLPNSFGFGVSYMKINKLLLAADFLYENWGDASYQGATDAFQNRTRLAIGAEYLPEYRGRNYFQAIRYRAGFHYGDSYIKVSPENGGKGSGYKEYGASIGLGFPMLDNRSMVNVAFEYVKVKPGEAFMIDEQYFRVTLNYTFNERWFFKFKLN